MLIDWFTVIAQVINFLVLAWLLKRFLYRPILNAIDAREKRIATELADADAKSAEAEQQRDEFLHKNAAFDAEQTTRMNQLNAEVKTERLHLLDSVRQESENLRDKLQLALKNEQQSLQKALSQHARKEVFDIARKALSDLADSSIESRITAIFIKRLQGLTQEERAGFKSAFQSTIGSTVGSTVGSANKDSGLAINNPLIVRTTFALTKEQCTQIENAIKDVFGYETAIGTDSASGRGDEMVETMPLQFLIDAEVISGIEISANGQKIAWSINDYLTSLAQGVDQLLKTISNDQSNEQGNHEIST